MGMFTATTWGRNLAHLAPIAAIGMALCAAPPAAASVLYSNGTISGQTLGFTINNGYAVSNSFTLSSAATISSISFGSWVEQGDSLNNVMWSIVAAPEDYSTGAMAQGSSTFLDSNGEFDIFSSSFETGDVTLAAGTYYLVLQNAVTSQSGFAYWDENFGPSTASDSSIGPLTADNGYGSESFEIFSSDSTSATPEPAAWSLMLVGFGGLGAVLRANRRRAIA